jgi:hypothetical protein
VPLLPSKPNGVRLPQLYLISRFPRPFIYPSIGKSLSHFYFSLRCFQTEACKKRVQVCCTHGLVHIVLAQRCSCGCCSAGCVETEGLGDRKEGVTTRGPPCTVRIELSLRRAPVSREDRRLPRSSVANLAADIAVTPSCDLVRNAITNTNSGRCTQRLSTRPRLSIYGTVVQKHLEQTLYLAVPW